MRGPFSVEGLGHRLPWALLAFLSQSLGLLFLFVGGLITVTVGVVPPNCISGTTCHAATLATVDYGIMVARVLLVLGLFGLATGAGLHLTFRTPPLPGAGAEEVRMYLYRRRGELAFLALCILLLFLVISWAALWFSPPIT